MFNILNILNIIYSLYNSNILNIHYNYQLDYSGHNIIMNPVSQYLKFKIFQTFTGFQDLCSMTNTKLL